MISIRSVNHHYGNQPALHFKDWDISDGEHWLMLGESGSGKTTLMHIITGLLKPSQGEVQIDDVHLYALGQRNLDKFRGRNIGIIFQNPHLIPSLTIEENLLIAQTFAELKADKRRINEVLETLNIADKKNKYPRQLSQGQLQRVAIARAVINKPALIVADEPTSSLDDKNTAGVIELLITQSLSCGSTLIVSTHDKRVKDRLTNSYQL